MFIDAATAFYENSCNRCLQMLQMLFPDFLTATAAAPNIVTVTRTAAVYVHTNTHVECTERKKGVTLTQKVESLAELKFDPGFRVIIGENLSKIDSKSSQFDSNILQLLGIPSLILVP